MNYDEAIQYIHSSLKFGIKCGLSNIKRLLNLLDNPQDKLKFVHVAGTNGKGSTVTFISQILIEAQYKVGIFTSPYIERFTERIKIGDFEIEQEYIANIVPIIKDKIKIMVEQGWDHPTEFEIVTAIALKYFYDKNCDIVVLEVGLGGRLDSTNIIEKVEACVITQIGLDHMNILGDTIEEISFEKAGIIKENSDVIVYKQDEEILNVIKQVAVDKNSNIIQVDFSNAEVIEKSIYGSIFNYNNYMDIKINLIGNHQVKNACVAIETIEILRKKGYKILDKDLLNGLSGAKWQGRFEVINNNPLIILDGCHNESGVKAFVKAVNDVIDKNVKKTIIIGVLKDKEVEKIVDNISSIADFVITVKPDSDRALDPDELKNMFIKNGMKATSSNSVRYALERSFEECDNGVIIGCGSLYMIGKLRSYIIQTLK